MTGSDKVYSAPKLESLSLRSTQDITIDFGLMGSITIPTLGLGS